MRFFPAFSEMRLKSETNYSARILTVSIITKRQSEARRKIKEILPTKTRTGNITFLKRKTPMLYNTIAWYLVAIKLVSKISQVFLSFISYQIPMNENISIVRVIIRYISTTLLAEIKKRILAETICLAIIQF